MFSLHLTEKTINTELQQANKLPWKKPEIKPLLLDSGINGFAGFGSDSGSVGQTGGGGSIPPCS